MWCGLPDAYLPAFLPVRWIQSEQTRLPSPRNTACPITSNTPPTTRCGRASRRWSHPDQAVQRSGVSRLTTRSQYASENHG